MSRFRKLTLGDWCLLASALGVVLYAVSLIYQSGDHIHYAEVSAHRNTVDNDTTYRYRYQKQ